jgi:hypothetical protein
MRVMASFSAISNHRKKNRSSIYCLTILWCFLLLIVTTLLTVKATSSTKSARLSESAILNDEDELNEFEFDIEDETNQNNYNNDNDDDDDEIEIIAQDDSRSDEMKDNLVKRQVTGQDGSRSRSRSTKRPFKVKMPENLKPTSSNNNDDLAGMPATFIIPPFVHSNETLNGKHGDVFAGWIKRQSDKLYQMSLDYSGYNTLNEVLYADDRADVKFAWINFTEMIIEISETISEVLYNKTVIVKHLSELVEDSFDKYRNNSKRVEKSAKHIYYDAKSPHTFCDVFEAAKKSIGYEDPRLTTTTKKPKKTTKMPDNDTLIDNNSTDPTQNSLDSQFQPEQNEEGNGPSQTMNEDDNLDYGDEANGEKNENENENEDEIVFYKKKSNLKFNEPTMSDANHKHIDNINWLDIIHPSAAKRLYPTSYYNSIYQREFNSLSDSQKNNYERAKRQANPNERKTRPPGPGKRKPGKPGKNRNKKPGFSGRIRTTTVPTSQADNSSAYGEDSSEIDFELAKNDYSHFSVHSDLWAYWNITCINRTFDENFKNFQVN